MCRFLLEMNHLIIWMIWTQRMTRVDQDIIGGTQKVYIYTISLSWAETEMTRRGLHTVRKQMWTHAVVRQPGV